MRSPLTTGLLIAFAVAVVLVFFSAYTVTPRTYALPLRFGEPLTARTEPGLYWKWPFIDNVAYVDRQILNLDIQPQEIRASDKKNLVVDAFARYRVVAPLKYYQASPSPAIAEARLKSILSSAVPRVLGQANFLAIVRDDRAGLMAKIRDDVNSEAKAFGVEIVDVRIRGADLPAANGEAVYKRMQSERLTEAQQIRSQGQQQALTIKATADREVAGILGDANGTASQTFGEADAARIKILGDAYGRDPEFARYFQSLSSYGDALKSENTKQVFINSNWDYFRYLHSPSAQGASPSPAAPAPAAPAVTAPAQ
jgi:modulator of FtsH protease HflC